MRAPLGRDAISNVPAWVERLAMPVWVTTSSGVITYLNSDAEQLIGHSRAACIGHSCYMVISGRTLEGAPFCAPNCLVRRLASGRQPIAPVALKMAAAEGQREVTVVVIDAGADQLVHCVVDAAHYARLREFIDCVARRATLGAGGPHAASNDLLTPREREILALLARDLTQQEIASRLGVSYVTVRNHVQILAAVPIWRRSCSAVMSQCWILIKSGDEQKDRRALEVLRTHLERASATLKIPETGTDLTGNPVDVADFKAYPVRFSLMEVTRNDPDEQLLVSSLLMSEPDLAGSAEPVAFPVFGRGRALYALVGDGIQDRNIREACQSMLEWCSCEIKAQNPGTDLLMSVDWSRPFGGRMVHDPELPLAGLSSFIREPAASAGSKPARKTSSARAGNGFVWSICCGGEAARICHPWSPPAPMVRRVWRRVCWVSTRPRSCGEETVGMDARPGGRVSVGTWLDLAGCHGVEGRFFSLGNSLISYAAESTGSPILAQPFFDDARAKLGEEETVRG